MVSEKRIKASIPLYAGTEQNESQKTTSLFEICKETQKVRTYTYT